MDWQHVASTLLLSALLGACGEGGPEGNSEQEAILTAATLGEQTILGTNQYLAMDRYALADPGAGEKEARLCRACHTLEAGGVNMIGPNLHAVFGRTAGTLEGFRYSQVLRDADFVWTPRALDAWLAQPAHFLPGNLMSFPGIADKSDRDALIAYLLRVTSSDEVQQ